MSEFDIKRLRASQGIIASAECECGLSFENQGELVWIIANLESPGQMIPLSWRLNRAEWERIVDAMKSP
jgi:hypothetical protein